MFGTCVNYATLRILGEVLDGENVALSKGRAWILSHGSATAAPQWAKIYLSVCDKTLCFMYLKQKYII